MTWHSAGRTGSASSRRAGSWDRQSLDSRPQAGPPPGGEPAGDNQGWNIFSYLIAGMVAYGLIGWLVAWLTHIPVLLPVGALAGLVCAIGGVAWKYGRPHRDGGPGGYGRPQ